jgi:hypothetical protein
MAIKLWTFWLDVLPVMARADRTVLEIHVVRTGRVCLNPAAGPEVARVPNMHHLAPILKRKLILKGLSVEHHVDGTESRLPVSFIS